MDIPDLKISRINNVLIMLTFYDTGFRREDLACLNHCQLYLQCTSLANLATGQDTTLIPRCGQEDLMQPLHPDIPGQDKPDQQKRLDLLANSHLKLLSIQLPSPTGLTAGAMADGSNPSKTVMALDHIRIHQCLYHWNGEWQVHHQHTNLSTRHLKFHAMPTRTTPKVPPNGQCTTVLKHPT